MLGECGEGRSLVYLWGGGMCKQPWVPVAMQCIALSRHWKGRERLQWQHMLSRPKLWLLQPFEFLLMCLFSACCTLFTDVHPCAVGDLKGWT